MLLDSSHALLSPWKEFLAELDGKLTEPVALHCIGGFVVCFFYGLQRITADIDFYTAVTDYPIWKTSEDRGLRSLINTKSGCNASP